MLNLKNNQKDQCIMVQLYQELTLNLYYTGDTQASKTAFYPH